MLRLPSALRRVGLLWVGLCVLAGPAVAQEYDWYEEEEAGDPVTAHVKLGLGFTVDPETFMLSGEVPIELARGFTLGPLVQAGFNDDRVIIATTAHAAFSWDLGGPDSTRLRGWRPIIGAGFGPIYWHQDRDNKDDRNAIGLLINFNAGIEYWMTERAALTSDILMGVMPIETGNENLLFSWRVLGVRFAF